MRISKVDFWSDHIDAPRPIFRNLSNVTIEKRMRAALDSHDGDGDLFAIRECIGTDTWTTDRFCLIKIGGKISRDPEAWPGTSK